MTQENEWWKPTANHVWRVYFSLVRKQDADPDAFHAFTPSERTIYNACNAVRRNLPLPGDANILRMFYTTPRGMEIHNVEDYSLRHSVPVAIIWKTVRYANRAVMTELGLLDRKS